MQRNVELWIFPIARCASGLHDVVPFGLFRPVPMLSVKRVPCPRACLFYGMYDYPVIDYYFETIRRPGTSRLLADSFFEAEYFPSRKAEYRASISPRIPYFLVAEYIISSFRSDRLRTFRFSIAFFFWIVTLLI